ncbi:MAG: DUF4142 domain-containing protein [Aureliella sp.]
MRTTLRYFALLATIASASSFAVAQENATQAGRRQAEQSPLSTQSSTQSRAAAGQAGQVAPAGAHAMQGMNVSQFLAHELRRGNEAEVELGRLASEKAQNDQVKKFAQMMVEQHQQFIQKLQQMEQRGGAAGAAGAGAALQGGLRQHVGQSEPEVLPREQRLAQREATSDRLALGNNRRGTGNVRNSESGTDGVRSPQGAPAPGGASQASTTAGEAPGTTEPGTPPTLAGRPLGGTEIVGQTVTGQKTTEQTVAGQPAGGQAIAGQAGVAAGHMMGNQVPQQLAAVFDQACDTELQMTKQMLSEEQQGHDFDMAYIGQQIVAHTCMLAKLQAVRNSGPQDLQQLATQGEQATRHHLDMAKQIAQQLKSKEGSSSQSPTRSASSSAKQPSSAERENK